jgi:NhaP-type Na+/H+ or K+/H+ antiporter
VANGYANPDKLKFDTSTFTFLLLPPIIYREGFCINRELFLSKMNTILMLACVGTCVSVFITGNLLLGMKGVLGDSYAFPELTSNEAYLYACIISAVDPVAVAATVRTTPYAYAIYGTGAPRAHLMR